MPGLSQNSRERSSKLRRNLVRWVVGLVALQLCVIGIVSARLEVPIFRLHAGGDYWRGPFTIYRRELRDGGNWTGVMRFVYRPVEGASPFSFQVLTNGYARDAFHTYRDGERIEADPRTFVVLSRGYARDDHSVFRSGLRTAGDASSFVVLPDGYTKDRRSVQRDDGAALWKLVEGRKVPFDAASFNPLGCGLVRDATGFYVIAHERTGRGLVGLRLINIDDSTFEVLHKDGNCVIRDARFDYHDIDLQSQLGAALMSKASPRLVKDLGTGYWKSTQGIEYRGHDLEEADSGTFEILGDGYARDSTHVFFADRIVPGADPRTFQALSAPYAQHYISWVSTDLVSTGRIATSTTLRSGAPFVTNMRRRSNSGIAIWTTRDG